MRRRTLALAITAIVLGLVVGRCVLGSGGLVVLDPPRVQVTTHSDDALRATCHHPRFGNAEVNVTSPDGVGLLVDLKFNGSLFALELFPTTDEVFWYGRGTIVRPRDKQLLSFFIRELATQLDLDLREPWRGGVVVGSLGVLSWLSQAPAYFTMPDAIFRLSGSAAEAEDCPPRTEWCEATSSCLGHAFCVKRTEEIEGQGEGGFSSSPGEYCSLTWLASGHDGFLSLPHCCFAGGGSAIIWPESHDACTHFMETAAESCGWIQRQSPTKINVCQGRCGENCGSPPIYTQDCFDHDYCVHHGSAHAYPKADVGGAIFHPDCGDEFWEATDDWLAIHFGTLYLSPDILLRYCVAEPWEYGSKPLPSPESPPPPPPPPPPPAGEDCECGDGWTPENIGCASRSCAAACKEHGGKGC